MGGRMQGARACLPRGLAVLAGAGRLLRRSRACPRSPISIPSRRSRCRCPASASPSCRCRTRCRASWPTADKPVVLPPAKANEAWSQPGGVANNAPGHLALASAVTAGLERGRRHRLQLAGRVTASPIVYDGRVYTLDAAATVSAFATRRRRRAVARLAGARRREGARKAPAAVWPPTMAASMPSSGFGIVAALDPKTGKKLWEKNLGTPVRSAPTAAGDRVFVVTKEGRFFCLAGADGSELWAVRGLPQQASRITRPARRSTATSSSCPILPASSSRCKYRDGSAVWTESLARTRTTSQLNALSDAARPAIDGGTVFAVGHAGRMVATQQKTGERLWSLNVPGTQTPWVAGENVFVVDTSGQLLAISRRDGKIVWTVKLPGAAHLVGADARRRPAVARLEQGHAGRRRGDDRQGRDAAGSRQPVSHRPGRGPGPHVHPDRQRPADLAESSAGGCSSRPGENIWRAFGQLSQLDCGCVAAKRGRSKSATDDRR